MSTFARSGSAGRVRLRPRTERPDGGRTIPRDRDARPTLEEVLALHRRLWLDDRPAGLADAVKATKLGAFNFLEKPLTPEGVLLAVASALELRQTRRVARALRAELGFAGQMVGRSSAMALVRQMITRVAPTDARVMITGESGTGKELVASAIHDGSSRRDKPFVRVNCAAIPRDLVESEMFGHERGAFTGATQTRIGRFELAHHGTLFLDEVGDLGPDAQAKLLRAIEAKEIQRVGGNRVIRAVSATARHRHQRSDDHRGADGLHGLRSNDVRSSTAGVDSYRGETVRRKAGKAGKK